MNLKETIKDRTEQLKMCFFNDKCLPARIAIFICTGLCVLWLYVVDIIWMALVEGFALATLRSVGGEYNRIIKNENRASSFRVAYMVMGYPIFMTANVMPAFCNMFIAAIDILFNCFAFITSLGKSQWKEIVYND